MLLCLKTETELASEMPCFLKELGDGQVPPKEYFFSVNFICSLFSLLDFLTPGDGTNRFSQYIGKELPVNECRRSQKIGDLT
jgi:hypothetical protein